MAREEVKISQQPQHLVPHTRRPVLDGLPTECLQRIATHLRASPTSLPDDSSHKRYASAVVQPQSLASVRNLLLVNRRLYSCLLPSLYACPVIHTLRQAALLYRSLILSDEDRSGLIKGIRLDASYWSPEPVQRSSRDLDSVISRETWTRSIRTGAAQTIWPEDGAVLLVAEVLECVRSQIKVLVMEQSWLYYALRVVPLFQAITRLQPKEVHFFGVEPALTETDREPCGPALSFFMPWLHSTDSLTILDISDLAMHESLVSMVATFPRPLEVLRFKIREACPTVKYPELVQPLGRLFAPRHVDFTFLGVAAYTISHRLVTETFTSLDSLALHAAFADEGHGENRVNADPNRQEVFWDGFTQGVTGLPRSLAIHTSRLGNPLRALLELPHSVEHLLISLGDANPTTLLVHGVTFLKSKRLPPGLKTLKLDVSQSNFSEQQLLVVSQGANEPKSGVNEYLDMWHILEPAASKLADKHNIGLFLNLGDYNLSVLTNHHSRETSKTKIHR